MLSSSSSCSKAHRPGSPGSPSSASARTTAAPSTASTSRRSPATATPTVERLLADPGIVRNRLKIASTIGNARAFIAVREEFGSFDAYVWRFVDGKPKLNAVASLGEIPATTPESDAMSKDLKKRGFRFVGSTICYAFMQAAGLVNDHEVTCFRYAQATLTP